jgi:E3 ubiquitin-protein ligase RBX1
MEDNHITKPTGEENDDYVKKFELKKVVSVGLWGWDLKVDNCGICKNNLMDRCIECCSSDKDKCDIVWGTCDHAYHLHCISGWTKVRSNCPLCNEPWIIDRVGQN